MSNNRQATQSNKVFTRVQANFQNPEKANSVNCWWWLIGNVNKAAGHHVGPTLKLMKTFRWECEVMNWSDKWFDEIKNYRGYDLLHYLPIAALVNGGK